MPAIAAKPSGTPFKRRVNTSAGVLKLKQKSPAEALAAAVAAVDPDSAVIKKKPLLKKRAPPAAVADAIAEDDAAFGSEAAAFKKKPLLKKRAPPAAAAINAAATAADTIAAADDDASTPVAAPLKKMKRASVPLSEAAPAAKRTKKSPSQPAYDEPPPASDESVTDEQQAAGTSATAASLDDDARGDERLALTRFNLSAETLGALSKRGVSALFPIQAACFDHLSAGKDLIGRARTGMGKTLAFALPLVEHVRALREQAGAVGKYGRAPLGLVMAPTRELAQQVSTEVVSVAPSLETVCVYGGSPMGPSCTQLRNGVDLVVGTPGRIKDLAERGVLVLDAIAFAALDEADQMLDMGFAEDMQAILGQCTMPTRQTCLFSATLPSWVREVAPTYMRSTPTIVDLVGDKDVKASTDVRHLAIGAPGPFAARGATINDVIAMYASSTGRVIVFCDTKAECDALASSEELKVEAKVLHGDIPQQTREKVMAAFRGGRFRVLIATDVAARGLDMVVELVVQSKPPVRRMSGREDTETYVHRSGRTGRAGRKGICVTLCGPRDRQPLGAIERTTGNAFEWLGAPNPQTLLRTAAQTAATDAAAIGEEVTVHFRSAAADLLAARGGDAEEALAAALALATGTMKPPAHRSMITHNDGLATLHATMRSEIHGPGFIFGALRKVLPEGHCEGTENIRHMKLTADGRGAVFDVNEATLELLRPTLDAASNDWLKLAEELPTLKEEGYGGGGGGDWGKGGGGWGKGGGKGKGKGGGGGGDGFGKGKGGGKGGGKGDGFGKGKGGGKGGGKGDGFGKGKGGGKGGGWGKGGW